MRASQPYVGTLGTDNCRTRDPAVEIDVEGRLDRLEYAVRQLTDSVNQALQTITSASQTDTGISIPSCTIATKKVAPESRLHTDLSHSCSFLDEASANIDAIRQSPGNTTSQTANSELQYLSSRLTTTQVEQQISQDSATFYIPSKAIGYRLISSKVSFLQESRSLLTSQRQIRIPGGW